MIMNYLIHHRAQLGLYFRLVSFRQACVRPANESRRSTRAQRNKPNKSRKEWMHSAERPKRRRIIRAAIVTGGMEIWF
jgi:hypothetical protein